MKDRQPRTRVKSTPLDSSTRKRLAVALAVQERGDFLRAESIFKGMLDAHPNHPEIYTLLGNLYWQAGKIRVAATMYESALQLAPDLVDAVANLGAILWILGEQDEAIACYKRATEINRGNADAYYNLGGAYHQLGDGDEAVSAFKEAIRLRPGFAAAYQHLGNAYYEQGHYDSALECYWQVVSLNPSGGAEIRRATAVPLLPRSNTHIEEIRTRLDHNLEQLGSQKLHVGDPIRENGYTNFFLAYHGQNDRPLQEKHAHLYTRACPSLQYTAEHCNEKKPREHASKIRVGFISKFLMNHSIGNTSKGIIARLSRKHFHVCVIFRSPPRDETARFIAKQADDSIVLPNDLPMARNAVANMKLDILFYQDIGLDPFTFFLAFSRLAPVQCTSFGHPVTTGIPTLDYYISTDAWEPEDGDQHYSERLVRLRNVPSVAYYYKPPVPKRLKPRSHFGLNDADHIYVCPQTLFKFHPEFDEVLAGILRSDLKARIILIEGIHKHWGELLRARFAESIPDVANRVVFLPRQSGADFINLIAVSDIMLDTLHFCGFNTTLQAFAVGVPVVTLPGKFMRSRHTLAFYNKMDIQDCVATNTIEYVTIAVRLGTERGYRDAVSSKILNRQELLWEDTEVIKEFERFFTQACDTILQAS